MWFQDNYNKTANFTPISKSLLDTAECGEGEVCVARDSCLEYKRKLQQRRDATAQGRPEERAKMVEQLKAMICHKIEKKVCCPVIKTGEQEAK